MSREVEGKRVKTVIGGEGRIGGPGKQGVKGEFGLGE
jgi:hypothetical protein